MKHFYWMSQAINGGKKLLNAIAAITLSFSVSAASITPADYAALAEKAMARKYVAVLVSLNTGIPLAERKEQAAKIASLESALLRNLGNGVLASAVWSNGIGQVGLMVTQEGLAQLVEHPGVQRVMADPGHSVIHDPYGQLPKIQEMIDKSGSATVLIIQQLDNLEWGLGIRGEAEFKFSTALENEFRTKAPEFLASLPAQAILNLAEAKSRAASGLVRRSPTVASPEIVLVVNQEGFLHLQARRDIRSLRMPELEGAAPVQLDSRALDTASKDGYASVIISLKRPAGYSAAQGYMSKRAWDAQVRSLRSAMNDIIGSVYPQAVPLIQHYDGLEGGSVVLPLGALRSLYDKPDPRIQSIRLNDPIEPALSISTGGGPGGVNVQQLWNNFNMRGAGQFVAVLDTGTQSEHAFFDGKSKGPGCYGTNLTNWRSVCPAQDYTGASVPGSIGAAAPCGDYVFPTPTYSPTSTCRHGTAVAGVAVGRNGLFGLNGVAPDANLFMVNIFSRHRSTIDPETGDYQRSAFANDIIRALNLIVQLTPSWPEITVNLSLAGRNEFFASNCDAISLEMADAIAQLKSLRVATVISTGNLSKRTAIGFPACMSHSIKVAASDKHTGAFATFSNAAPPNTFSGPIFVAPGTSIYTSVPGGSYDYFNGTSFAAPHVAGLYAIVKAAFPGISVDSVSAYFLTEASVPVHVPVSPPILPYTLQRVIVPTY